MQQRSDEWFSARCGKFTASGAKDLLTSGRGGKPSVTRSDYIARVACERMTGQVIPGPTSYAMERGKELEPDGLTAYEMVMGCDVQQAGFVAHPDKPFAGCSPDGLIGSDGLVEIKCPLSHAKHLDYLRNGTQATEYAAQVHMQLLCTDRQWCDVFSYHPEFPNHVQLARTRVHRDAEWDEKLNAALDAGEADVLEILEELQALKAAA